MPSLRHLIALVLLALWLPATQHCGLKAAGVIEGEIAHAADSACCESNDDPCSYDGCHVVEGSLIKSTSDTVRAPSPSLAACTCLVCLQLLPPILVAEPRIEAASSKTADPWVPVWHFVRRAAPIARAPSLVG